MEMLCAMVNNNVRCYNESMEFAERVEDTLDDDHKAWLPMWACSSSSVRARHAVTLHIHHAWVAEDTPECGLLYRAHSQSAIHHNTEHWCVSSTYLSAHTPVFCWCGCTLQPV